jgi:nitric oxide reductase NorE protein
VTLEASSASPASLPRLPGGEAGVWVFIFADMTLFAYIFVVFLIYRSHDLAMYGDSSALLNRNFGAINTLVLLTSSLLVVLALRAFRSARKDLAARAFAGTIICGLTFIVLKVFEYSTEIAAGRTVSTNTFFTFYYLLTGLHLMHLLLGLAVVAYLFRLASRPIHSSGQLIAIAGGTCYWHMVDFLWIVIFPLLYLVK